MYYHFYYSKIQFDFQKKWHNEGSQIHVHRTFFLGSEYTVACTRKSDYNGPRDGVYLGTGRIGIDTSNKPY